MANIPLGPGGWQYEKGFRICVTGLGSKATKPILQGLFGEFGHIIKIETPRSGASSYVSFQDRGDASDAIKAIDGYVLDGQRLTVSRAGDRPPPNMAKKETSQTKSSEILTTTNFEREEQRTARYMDENGLDKRLLKVPPTSTADGSSRKRSRSRETRSKRGRSSGRRSRSRSCSRSRGERRASPPRRRGRGSPSESGSRTRSRRRRR
mmetsp:Transcript_61082/g.169006  ORF Transcript_61082/g.169006 Transcript_61082/m.169006 type:complete len:208 (+) Transcript_61082:130-753(+)